MTISAKVLHKSTNSATNDTLTTFLLEYPRIIHAELLTHRLFSRNTSSSRAVPVQTFLKRITDNPFIPQEFSKNKPGMSATENLSGEKLNKANEIWKDSLLHVCRNSLELQKLGVHKQYANRLTETFQHTQVVVSATQFNNFFKLRNSEFAQPEIKQLAEAMEEAFYGSPTTILNPGDWHIPFIREDEQCLPLYKKILIGVARHARVSYFLCDGTNSDYQKDIDLAVNLITNHHMSPTEHIAVAMPYRAMAANFVGFVQLRKFIPEEDNGDIPDVPILNNKQVNDYFGYLFDTKEFNYEINKATV